MPHIHIKEFKPLSMPAKHDGIAFEYMATNVNHQDEHLIATNSNGKDFFLLFKEGTSKNLLKSDKISRPSSTHLIKKSLLGFANASELEMLESNVNDKDQNMHLIEDKSLKTIHDFADNFPSDKEVRIEVGFGSGRHLLHQAKKNPDILYIGIEIHRPSIEQVIKQINIQNLDNILLLDYDARLFLELVPSNLVGRIYVHFPVPWDKKPHRRVISPSFLQESIRVLMPAGKLELRTDSDNYFQYAFETFTALNIMHIEILKNREIAITSKYEDRWRRQEKNIYDITMHNDVQSPALDPIGDFIFSTGALDDEKLFKLNETTHRYENGFIHFERLYKTTNDHYVFRLSLGTFERPEHLYLIIGEQQASYFPLAPLNSRSNYKAHITLNELLYG
ncbi:MAG: tRNA (guanosine(46)-N7)-methyltransferase TrmB [Epsilonproteobacteria bacterium]|nr:MAG: tRNA (guanosine(46)-N7)-methyltransferase TrmB [Campylobacterota bacterium]